MKLLRRRRRIRLFSDINPRRWVEVDECDAARFEALGWSRNY